MITSFKNLDYSSGTDLVKCNKCDTLMLLPISYGVCPVCGESHCLMDIEQDCEFDIPGWEEPIVNYAATYCETGEIDEDGYSIPKLI